MKISLVTFLLSLFMTKSLENEEEKESVSLSRMPPPYYNQPVSTPYYCDSNLEKIIYYNTTLDITKTIDSIFYQLNNNTCLNFTRNKESQIKNTIGINFNISNNANTVELSKSKDCPTNVSLFKEVYLNKEHLLFFIGIALNITPEIRRPDSNDDVTVNRSNVNNTFYEQYYKQSDLKDIVYINGTDFDFKSPMFVDPYFLSNSSEPTYTIKDKLYEDYQYFKGITRPFRFNDYKHIFYYYCKATNNDDCMYGGYKPGNSIYMGKCKCPEYLTGDKCENFFPNSKNCTNIEKNFNATSEKKFFNLTITKGNCYFNITSQNGKNVSVTIENLAFDKTNCLTGKSFLEVLVRNDKGAGGINFCNNTKNKTLPALSNQVFLVFSNGDQNLTFNVSYVEELKNNLNRNNKQTFYSLQKCEYFITVQPKCNCSKTEEDKVYLNLIDSRTNSSIKSNSDISNWDCKQNFTFNFKNECSIRYQLLVQISHVGCNDNNIIRIPLTRDGRCRNIKNSDNTFVYRCNEL